jgi:hypothetical protein
VDAAKTLYEATADLDDPAKIWEIAAGLDLPIGELTAWSERQL